MCGDHDRCDGVMLLNDQRTIRYGVTWTMVEHRDHQRPDAPENAT
jgi:hypothetical protein